MKTCKPLRCKTFAKKAQQYEQKLPVDVFVVKCPFRTSDCKCENEKESLTEAFY